MKYKVSGKDLTQEGTNPQAVVNGHALAVSPDGKRVTIAGGGGIVSPVDHKRSYDIPVYSTTKLDTMVGRIEVGAYPNNVAFHPTLNIGVAEKSGGELTVFKAKSLARVKTIRVQGRPAGVGAGMHAFGAPGSKIIYGARGQGPGNQSGKPIFVPLDLTEEQHQQLKKAYGGSEGE